MNVKASVIIKFLERDSFRKIVNVLLGKFNFYESLKRLSGFDYL